jgi:hypothetical protein
MRQTELYRVIVDTETSHRWEASFTGPPTIDYLHEALEFEIAALQASQEDARCDESDEEVLESEIEDLLVIQEILQILGRADQDFWNKIGWHGISVAKVRIGRIRVETSPVYIEAKE